MNDYGTICAILDRWVERWKPQHDAYMAESKARGWFKGNAPPAFDDDGNLNDVGAYE